MRGGRAPDFKSKNKKVIIKKIISSESWPGGYDDRSMSELRQDPIIRRLDHSFSRARQAAEHARTRSKKNRGKPTPKKDCPFEDLQKSGNGTIFQAWPSTKKWEIAVIPNKYPALVHGESCAIDFKKGIYDTETGIGEHELIVTRDHNKFIRRPRSCGWQLKFSKCFRNGIAP